MTTLTRRVSRTFEVGLTTIVAWTFGLASAAVLFVIASGLLSGKYQFATPLTLADPEWFSAGGVAQAKPWGLTFVGQQGAFLAAGMAVGALIALGLSMMFTSGARRLGLFLTVLWSGLWAVDAALVVANTWSGSWFAAGMPALAGAAALIVIFGLMVHRALLLWRVQVTL
jgi:hypothetical protein